jgi:hypothetical protein
MRLTERNKRTPSGLTRFLGEHESCPKGFEVLRDSSLVTVLCRGCDSSFAYLTEVGETEPTEVERALQSLAGAEPAPKPAEPTGPPPEPSRPSTKASSPPSGEAKPPSPTPPGALSDPPDPPRWVLTRRPTRERPSLPYPALGPPSKRNGAGSDRPPAVSSNGASRAGAEEWDPSKRTPKPRRGVLTRPLAASAKTIADDTWLPRPGRMRPRRRLGPFRLRPPGPQAVEKKRIPRRPLGEALEIQAAGIARAISRRRRPIAMAALSLAGAYVVLVLSTGGERGATSPGTPLGSAELPLQAAPPGEAEDPVAGDARTLEPLAGGGPDAAATEGGDGSFEVSLPPDWEHGSAAGGADLFQSASGEAEVLIEVETGEQVGLGDLGDRAAAFLAISLSPGAEVKRIPAREESGLLAVARSSGGDEVQTAYVAKAGDVGYLVVEGHDDDAPAIDRLQAESIVRSFEPAGEPRK